MSIHQSDSTVSAYRDKCVSVKPSAFPGFIHVATSGPLDVSPALARVVAADLVAHADKLDPAGATPTPAPAPAPEPTAVTPPTLAEARETMRTVTMAAVESIIAPKPTTPDGVLAYMLQSEKHILAVRAATEAVKVAKARAAGTVVKADPEPADPLACCEICIAWACRVEPVTGHRAHCTGVKA